MGLSGYLFPITKEKRFNEYTPLFIAHGLEDTTIPKILSEKSFKALDAKKHKITYYYEPELGHSVNENVLAEAK